MAESFFATLKVELDQDGPWWTRADAHCAVFESDSGHTQHIEAVK